MINASQLISQVSIKNTNINSNNDMDCIYDHYNIKEELGNGAYAKVFLVECKKTSNKYALKRVKSPMYDSFGKTNISIYNREVNTLEQLSHENLIKFYKNGTYQFCKNKDLLGKDYAEKLETVSKNRDDARKNRTTIGTIKELKE